jgi:NADH dehydrogenase/NADH:ubiquinone oxidoreductase subunit G
MTREVEIVIDGQAVQALAGTTLLKAAEAAGIDIPVLCYFDHTTANGLCRLCAVESQEGIGLQAACVTAVQDGAHIKTRSERVDRARRTILEMLASSVDLSESPELQSMLEEYQAVPKRFEGGKSRDHQLIDDNPMYVRDYDKCVLCWRCVQVCAEDAQYTYAINFSGRGFDTSIGTFFDQSIPETTCVFCGQCVGVCPTGALKAKGEFLLEQGVSPEDIFQQTRPKRKGKGSPRRD